MTRDRSTHRQLYLVTDAMTFSPSFGQGADATHIGDGVFAVADGADDHPGSGEKALFEVLSNLVWPAPAAESTVGVALRRADTWLGQQSHGRAGAATVTAAVWTGEHFLIGQIGDSRAYVVRRHQIMLLAGGSAIGTPTASTGDIAVRRLGDPDDEYGSIVTLSFLPEAGDRLLLCTDGLWRALVEDEMIRALDMEFSQVCGSLRQLASARSSEDASAVVIAAETAGQPS